MNRNRIAVLRGGPSSEYEVSMQTGKKVAETLRELGYFVKDVTISRKGDWLYGGFEMSPDRVLSDVDVVFIALHGAYGEDGVVQRLVERHRLPYTGSGPMASAIAMNKFITKEHLKETGIKMPGHVRLIKSDVPKVTQTVYGITQAFGPHYIIKPVTGGSSIDTEIAYHAGELAKAIEKLLGKYDEVLVEELIKGREATVGILENFRGQRHYVLPEVEIVPPQNSNFFSYDVKYNGQTDEICPGRFSKEEKKKLADAASVVHNLLNLTQYSRSDFIVSDGEVYFLEVNTLPGLTEESLLPKSVGAVGCSYSELVDHLIKTAVC